MYMHPLYSIISFQIQNMPLSNEKEANLLTNPYHSSKQTYNYENVLHLFLCLDYFITLGISDELPPRFSCQCQCLKVCRGSL